jgi:hypothetical protein
MVLTQEQPLLPPIKEERLLPTSSVRYTQEGWVSEKNSSRRLGEPSAKGDDVRSGLGLPCRRGAQRGLI